MAESSKEASQAVAESATVESKTSPSTSKPYFRRNTTKRNAPPYEKPNNRQNPQYNNKVKQDINKYMQPSGYMAAMSSYYQLQIKFDGFETLCHITFETLRVREPRAVQFITRDRFTHAMKVILFYKYYYYGYISGMFADRQLIDNLLMPNIKQIAGTSIPNVIADYIESIGSVSMNYVNVKPYIYTLDQFFNNQNIFWIIDDNGNATNVPCTFENFEHQYTVGAYTTNFVRVRTILHCLRCVNVEETEGKHEMLINTDQVHDNIYRAKSHFSLSESVGNRGVVYGFWNVANDRNQGDILQFEDRFVGKQFFRDDFLRSIVANSIVLQD